MADSASAAFDITSDNSHWKIALSGANNDYYSDQQTGQGQSDIVGGIANGIDYPSMYWYYDPGTSSTNGTMYFRTRISGKDGDNNWTFDNALMVGLDFANPGFGGMDLFLVADAGAKDDISLRWAGAQGNTSPSTTSIGSQIGTTLAPTGLTSFNATNYSFQYADAVDLRPGVSYDLDGNSSRDGFVSFAVPFQSIVEAAQSAMNLSVTNATAVKWGVITSTQTNAINQDVNGATKAEARDSTPGVWNQVYTAQGTPTNGIAPIRSTWALASASAISPNPVNLGAVRVGSAFSTRNLTLSNTAANDGNSERLDAAITATSGSATGSGTVSGLNPGSSSTNLVVGLTTPGTAGLKTGTATVSPVSNGTGTSGAGNTPLTQQSVTITGTAYDYANPTGLPATVAFGNVRPGGTLTRTASVTNQTITSAAYQDSLNAAINSSTNARITGSGFTTLSAGSTGTITLNANTAQPGSLGGTVTVGLVSNANGVQGLSNQSLANGSITTTGGVYAYANPGTLSAINQDFGNLRQGTVVSGTVNFTNNATAANAPYTDDMVVSGSGASGNVTGGAAQSLAANSAGNTATYNYSLNTALAGFRSGSVTLNYTSTPKSGVTGLSSLQVGSQTVNASANVYRYAAGSLQTTTVALGNVHAGTGGGSLTAGVNITNSAANDGYSDRLGVNLSGLPSGITYAAGASVAPGAGSQQGGLLTIGTSTPRQVNSTLGASLVSIPTVPGLDSGYVVGTNSVQVTANIYSGLSTWTSSGGGNWADFPHWETSGGAPGTDAAFTTTDTATFGSAIGSIPTVVAVNVPVSVNSVTFNNAAAGYTVAGPGTLSFAGTSAALNSLAGSHGINAPVVLNSNLTVGVSGAGNVLSVNSFGGGNRSLTKSGAGTLAITGDASGLTGSAIVDAGTLEIGGLFGGDVAVNSGGTLLGDGQIGGTVALYEGAIISAGSADRTGELFINGAGTSLFEGGSAFAWDVLNVAGSGNQDALAGVGFDTLSFSGPLSITATAANPILISLNSLSAQGVGGAVSGWDGGSSYEWTILTAQGGINGFDAAAFHVDKDAFFARNGGQETGYFFVSESGDGKSITLSYAVPEPTLVLTLSGTVLSALVLRPTRRRNVKS